MHVAKAHVLACALNLLGMSDVRDVSTQFITSEDVWMLDDTERRQILTDTAMQIVEDNVDLLIHFFSNGISGSTTLPADSVYSYACEVLSLGLFYLNFRIVFKREMVTEI